MVVLGGLSWCRSVIGADFVFGSLWCQIDGLCWSVLVSILSIMMSLVVQAMLMPYLFILI